MTLFLAFSKCFDKFGTAKFAASVHVKRVSICFTVSRFFPLVAPGINIVYIALYTKRVVLYLYVAFYLITNFINIVSKEKFHRMQEV